MFGRKITTMIAAAAAGSLILGSVCFAAEGSSQKSDAAVQDSLLVANKNEAEYTSAENIYAVLASDGSFESAYVIRSFDVTKAGVLTGYGAYDSVENLTTRDRIENKNGVQTVSAEAGKFYYQGNMEALKLPWKMSLEYYLDGKKLSAEEVAGKSGALEIRLKTEKEPSANPEFYDNYMLQATFTLDMEKCSNVQAEGAAVAEAGSSKTVIFTVLPGQDADLSLTADVKDFEMDAASVAAVPFSMAFDMPDTDEMADGLTQLSDAIRQLDEGVGELVSGMDLLTDNAGTLKTGSATFENGLDTVSANSGTLVNASAQIQGALQMIAENLGSVDMSSLEALAELPNGLYSLADALDQVAAGLAGVPQMYGQVYGNLNTMIGAISGSVLSESELASLEAAAGNGSEEASAAVEKVRQLNALAAQLTQAQAGVEQVDGIVQNLAGVVGQLAAGIRQQADALTAQLASQDIASAMTSLQSGVGMLAENYKEFHTGLTAYTNGVDTLASGYDQLSQGLNAYLDGVQQAADGTGQLKAGTSQLAVSTENIPEEMQKQIDEFMEDYQFDFTPVSFIDERNEHVTAVQFILSTPRIAVQEETEPEEAEDTEEQNGIINRIKGLFS